MGGTLTHLLLSVPLQTLPSLQGPVLFPGRCASGLNSFGLQRKRLKGRIQAAPPKRASDSGELEQGKTQGLSVWR